MEMQAMGELLSLVASCHISRRIGGKAKALVLPKVKSKRDDRIIVQSSNDFSRADFKIHISQEEISSRISEVID